VKSAYDLTVAVVSSHVDPALPALDISGLPLYAVQCADATSNQVIAEQEGNGLLKRMEDFGSVFLRLALGASFLSAVGDRFGFWGAFGKAGVAWGDFSHFIAYTAKLNWFMPSATIPALAWAATFAETLLGIALVLGAFTRVAAFLSGLLLLLFALVMTFALGPEAPLSFSVFSASAGAFLLATCSKYSWSLDSLRAERILGGKK